MKRFIVNCLLTILGGIFISCSSKQDKVVFVILPDTQTYLEQCPEVLISQFDWIVGNHKEIDIVLQVGDLTQENYPAEWWILQQQFARLDKVNLPYALALGNHDMGSRPGKYADVYNTTLANRYFPLQEMKTKNYFGQSFDGETIDHYYINLQAGDMDFVVINFAFGPSDEALDWANHIARNNSDKLIIVNTHAYLYSDSTHLGNGDNWLPQNYGIGKEPDNSVNDGEGIWEKFVSRHSNVIAVFCGHILNSGVGTLVSKGVNGNNVYQMLANFQRGVHNSVMGGEGYLRIVTFDKKKKKIDVKTYSTWNKAYHPSGEHNFSFQDVDFQNKK